MCSVNWFELKWLFHIFPWSKHASDPTPPYLGLTANMTLSKSVDPPFTLMTLPTYVVWLQKITFYLYPCVVCLSYCFKEVFDIFIFLAEILQDSIKYILCLTTPVDVVLLAVTFSSKRIGTVLSTLYWTHIIATNLCVSTDDQRQSYIWFLSLPPSFPPSTSSSVLLYALFSVTVVK